MRQSLVLLLAALLSTTVLACGSGSTTHTSAPTSTVAAARTSTTVARGYSKRDGDSDFDDAEHYDGHPPNDDLGLLASYGPKASPAVMRAVASLIKRYYTASAAANAPTACSLLSANLAAGIATTSDGASSACAAAMSQLLAQQHARLVGENPATMAVTTVHVKGNLGLAALSFKTAPEAEIVVEREAGKWKIDALFDTTMT